MVDDKNRSWEAGRLGGCEKTQDKRIRRAEEQKVRG